MTADTTRPLASDRPPIRHAVAGGVSLAGPAGATTPSLSAIAPPRPNSGYDPRMRPLLHPTLVNGRSGDPALYVETLFEKRAILFDLGDIAALPARKILRLEQVFVSHTHIDHFVGFDRLLRLYVGR